MKKMIMFLLAMAVLWSSCANIPSDADFKPRYAPPPPVATAVPSFKVVSVNREFNFVTINEGRMDGLRVGDLLKVFSQGQEKATIRIEKFSSRFSVASIIEENPMQQVVEGDEILKV